MLQICIWIIASSIAFATTLLLFKVKNLRFQENFMLVQYL